MNLENNNHAGESIGEFITYPITNGYYLYYLVIYLLLFSPLTLRKSSIK